MGKGDCVMANEKSVNDLKEKTSSTVTVGNAGSRVILIQPESNSSINQDNQQQQQGNNGQRKDHRLWVRKMFGIIIFLASISSMILGFIALVAYFNLHPFSDKLFVSEWSEDGHSKNSPDPFYVAELGAVYKCEKGCVHKRFDPRGFNVIHDTETRWSAQVDPRNQRCLLFAPMSRTVPQCPKQYPWILDKYMGLLPCRVPLVRSKIYVDRVTRLINPLPLKNITGAGNEIKDNCGNFTSMRVIAVIISYRSLSPRFIRSAPNMTSGPAHDPKNGKLLSAKGAHPADVYVFRREGLVDKRSDTVVEVLHYNKSVDISVYKKLSKIVRKDMKEAAGR